MNFSTFFDLCKQYQTTTWLIMLIIFLFSYTVLLNWWYRNYPPHPFIYPFFGNLFFMKGKRTVERSFDVKDKHGIVPKLISYFLPGGFQLILFNEINLIKQIFLTDSDYNSDRPDVSYLFSGGKQLGIIRPLAPMWIKTRRVTMQILRDLGFGKSIIQLSIEDQCDFLNENLLKYCNNQESFNIFPLFLQCSSDIMSLLLFGRKPAMEKAAADQDDDQENIEILKKIEEIMHNGSRILWFLSFLRPYSEYPILRKLLKTEKNIQNRQELQDYFQKQIHLHRENLVNLQEPRDFIDYFLLMRKKNESLKWNPTTATGTATGAIDEDNDDDENRVFTDENLVMIIQDLLMAGTDTTAVTMTWAIALLCHKEDVQEKMYQELKSVFGDSTNGKYPNYHEIHNCPYTRAVLSEVLRFGLSAPASLPHVNHKNYSIDNYYFPKNSTLLANIFYISRNPKLWKHPDDFYPQHFYNEETNVFVSNENLIPFGVGKRACLGEALARQELFTFISFLIMRYQVKFDEVSAGKQMEIISGNKNGLVRSPLHFQVKIFPR